MLQISALPISNNTIELHQQKLHSNVTKAGNIDLWNGMEYCDISPHFVLTKKPEILYGNSIINRWCWSNWMTTYRRMQIDPFFSSYTNASSKWIKDLNIKPDLLNPIKHIVINNVIVTGIRKNFVTTVKTGTN